MSHVFFRTRFTRAIGLCCVFALGSLSHWGYSRSSQIQGLWTASQGTTEPIAGKADARPYDVAGLPLAKLNGASHGTWRAIDAAGEAATRKYFEAQNLQRRLAAAEKELALLGRGVAAPQALVFPATLRAARAENEAERAINRAAGVALPARLDGMGLAVAAMRTQLLATKLSLVVLEKRFARRMEKLRGRLMRMAALQIDKSVRVERPDAALFANVVASIDKAAQALAPAGPTAAKPTAAGNGLRAIAAATAKNDLTASPKPPREVSAYAPLPDNRPLTVVRKGPEEEIDLTGVREAIEAYRKGDMASGDAHARRATHGVARTAIEWTALQLQPRKAGFRRIVKFVKANPDWPRRDWLLWRAEQSLYVDRAERRYATDYLKTAKPVSPIGRLVQARYLRDKGKTAEAARIVRDIWRDDRFTKWLEGVIIKEFGGYLKAADHRHRADRYFYRERYRDSVRIAGKAGKDIYRFAAARVAVARGASPEKFAKKFPARFHKDPTWIYAKVRRLRKAEKPQAAARALLAAGPLKSEAVHPASWWLELRMVARRLLDDGDAKTAYQVAKRHRSTEGASYLDAEFYAGWIALRFLKKPDVAGAHFSRALRQAKKPISRARAAYWQARVAEFGQDAEEAKRLYAIAAEHSSSYYGQLAHARLRGARAVPIRRATTRARGSARMMAIRVVELLKRIDEDSLAVSLAAGLARTVRDEAQIAAVGAIMKRDKDARGSLIVGKLASYRGIELDEIAFPDFGVPTFVPLANSADKSLVYAIARQESAFRTKAVSHAGAKGLMQMLTSTARRTAQRKGVPFDPDRLVSDPAFNAQLGAAHLGELMDEHPGSLILVIAAYNAGGPRVKQWIKAYGDPRKAGVDPIDWVERIRLPKHAITSSG